MIKNDDVEGTKVFFIELSNRVMSDDNGLKEIFDYFIETANLLEDDLFKDLLSNKQLFPYNNYISKDHLKMNKMKFLHVGYNDLTNKFELIENNDKIYRSMPIDLSIKEKDFKNLYLWLKESSKNSIHEEYRARFLEFKSVFNERLLIAQKEYIENQNQKSVNEYKAAKSSNIFSIYRLWKMFPQSMVMSKTKDKSNFIFELRTNLDKNFQYINKENIYDITKFLKAVGLINRDQVVLKKNKTIDMIYNKFDIKFIEKMSKDLSLSTPVFSLLLNSASDIDQGSFITIWRNIKKYAKDNDCFDDLFDEKSVQSLAVNAFSTFDYEFFVSLLEDEDLKIKTVTYYYQLKDSNFNPKNNYYRYSDQFSFSTKGKYEHQFVKKILASKYASMIDFHIVWIGNSGFANWVLYKDIVKYQNVRCVKPVYSDKKDWISSIAIMAMDSRNCIYLKDFISFKNNISEIMSFIDERGDVIEIDKKGLEKHQLNSYLTSKTKSNFTR